MNDKELLDHLHKRISEGAISLTLYRAGEGYAHVCVKTSTGYQFDAMAYQPALKQGA